MSETSAQTEQPEDGGTASSDSRFTWPKYGLFCLLLTIWLIAPIVALSQHPFGQAVAQMGLLYVMFFPEPLFKLNLRWFVEGFAILVSLLVVGFGLVYLSDALGTDPAYALKDPSGWHLAALFYTVGGFFAIEYWVGLGASGESEEDPEEDPDEAS